MTETESKSYEGWAIVELMGRQVLAGAVSEEIHYGKPLMRIDIPDPTDMGRIVFTKYQSPEALYGLTPCGENEVQRALADRYSLPPAVRMALPAPPEQRPLWPGDEEPGNYLDDHAE